MIKEEKLLCAFIIGAYKSGSCNHGLPEQLRKAQTALFEKFILTEKYFPYQEIIKTHPILAEKTQKIGTRPYIYNEHLEKVKKSIESISSLPFLKAIDNELFLSTALGCPASIYRVLNSGDGKLVGKHLYLEFKKELMILPGLEIPRLGDLVSGHWNHYLEILSDETIDKHLPTIENYFQEIRKK